MSVCRNEYFRKTPGRYHWDPIKQTILEGAYVPCKKCTNCKIQIAKEWAIRCCLELPYWDSSIFTTLTFRNDEMIDPSIHKEELSQFAKNLRNDLRNTGKKIKILGCGEYGGESGRKHYHAIIFGIGLGNEKTMIGTNETWLSENSIIEKNWTKGNVFNGVVTYNSCRYVASYVFKKYYDELAEEVYKEHGLEVPFQHTSGGIGKSYYLEWKNEILKRGYIMFNGVKQTIPRYFLDLYEKDQDNQQALKTLQINHAEDKFWKWYKDYTAKLSKTLCCDPDEFNANALRNVDYEFISEYMKYQREQNEAKENIALARNNLF